MAKRLPEGWKHSYCTLIAEGYTRSDAATAVGVAEGTIRRHQAQDQEFQQLYQAARETIRDKLRNEIWKLRLDEDRSTARWAYDHLIKWNLPEAHEPQRLEITGEHGGPLQLEARSTSLAAVVRILAQAGALQEGLTELGAGASLDALPGASALLAEPEQS